METDEGQLCTLRPADDGSFDELLAYCVNVYFEMMDDKTVWIGLYSLKDENLIAHVTVSAAGKLKINVNDPA